MMLPNIRRKKHHKSTLSAHGSLKFLVYSQIRLYNILWFMLQNAISKQNGKVFSDPSCVPRVDPTQYVVVKFRFRSKNKRTVSYSLLNCKLDQKSFPQLFHQFPLFSFCQTQAYLANDFYHLHHLKSLQ